ncbi:MAG: hypothetical protein HZB33_04825 [Nitrospirae bacterium]|nr:hypothetical protein [Nitrospirota bacterium]
MAVQCPSCGRGYDVTLFEFSRSITCACGKTVSFRHEQKTDEKGIREQKTDSSGEQESKIR